MLNKLLSLIETEDKKNPMTDEELAKQIGVGREKVNELRQAASVPSYLIRREVMLLQAIAEILEREPEISQRKMVLELNKGGFQLSVSGLNRYKKQISEIKGRFTRRGRSAGTRQPQAGLAKPDKDFFDEIVGYNGSLSQVIKLAKAAVLYPPYGLHMLISGSTGVGKSQLVEEIHRFAQAVRKSNLPLVVFNCADYGDNPQLLVAQLFGYKKGSFTGADTDRVGLVEKANKGILFLDEIHRLPPKGQEILFRIMDKEEFSRLGETDRTRKVTLMIIGATTENIESSLLNTFRRRIPVTLPIPPLEGRPNSERYKLIKLFFFREASRVNKRICVPKEIMKLLIFYKCAGNVGQLKSDIQVICAKAFLHVMSGIETVMKISMNDLPQHVRTQLMNVAEQKMDLDVFIDDEVEFVPHTEEHPTSPLKEDLSDYNIYQFMEKRMHELLEHSSSSEAKAILVAELESKIRATSLNIEHKYAGISNALLSDLVGEELMGVLEDLQQILAAELGTQDFSILKILCLHLSAAIERLRAGKPIVNPQCEHIKDSYRKEFRIALKITRMLSAKLDMFFPEDEAGFIALYLNHFFTQHQLNQAATHCVGLIIITHGEVAKAILDIAQMIVGIRHGVAICMGLEASVESVFERVRQAVKLANQGSGVLFLVDMGSLINVGDMVTEELGIPTRVIARVDTLLAMEAIRKSVAPTATLASTYDALIELGEMFPRVPAKLVQDGKWKLKKTIITTCFTGRGTALKIKRVIEDRLKVLKSDIEVIPLGLVESETDISKEIVYLQQANRDIILVTGMVNPHCQGIPFLPFEEVLSSEKFDTFIANVKLEEELLQEKTLQKPCQVTLEELFDPQLVQIFYSKIEKDALIQNIAGIMCQEQYVNEHFYDDIMERESWATSYIGDYIAIPHTATMANIIKPGIAIAVLKKPSPWDEEEVHIAFVLALKTEHKDLFLKFFNLIKETDLIDRVRKLTDSNSIIAEVLHYVRNSEYNSSD